MSFGGITMSFGGMAVSFGGMAVSLNEIVTPQCGTRLLPHGCSPTVGGITMSACGTAVTFGGIVMSFPDRDRRSDTFFGPEPDGLARCPIRLTHERSRESSSGYQPQSFRDRRPVKGLF